MLSGFPVAMGPVTTLGYHGNWVLTSNTYNAVQNQVNVAIESFMTNVGKAWAHWGTTNPDKFAAVVGLDTNTGNGYAAGSLLAKLDAAMRCAEGHLPYGRGLAGDTGGVGLSTTTAATSNNPVVAQLAGLWESDGSVAGNMEAAIFASDTVSAARTNMETVRQETLNVVGNAPLAKAAGVVPGELPGYVITFGPGGTGEFGLKNS